jgi:GH25 family lysozyme M1 (1,4-beta-N-acetylmuramidase)
MNTRLLPAGRGRRTAALVAAVILSVTFGATTPAGAATTSTCGANPPDSVQDAQHNHTMGSQVARHQGHRCSPKPTAFGPLAVVYGMDVSSYQGNVDWQTAWNNGARFAYIKATEGTYYTNANFTQQYNGSYNVGMIRGSYHFATPNTTNGATQANYFVDHGGGWSGDGKTLPGALDIEWNPYGAECYGLSAGGMVQWILDFSNTYHARTGVWPVIYTAQQWWADCTGNQGDFTSTNPLWVAKYASSAGTLPYAWGFYTFWQYADSGTFPGDQDLFNGAYDRLQALANG